MPLVPVKPVTAFGKPRVAGAQPRALGAGAQPRVAGAFKRDRPIYKPDFTDASRTASGHRDTQRPASGSESLPPWKKHRSSDLGIPGNLPIGMKPGLKPSRQAGAKEADTKAITRTDAKPSKTLSSSSQQRARPAKPQQPHELPPGADESAGSSEPTERAEVPLLKKMPKTRSQQPSTPRQPEGPPPQQPPAPPKQPRQPPAPPPQPYVPPKQPSAPPRQPSAPPQQPSVTPWSRATAQQPSVTPPNRATTGNVVKPPPKAASAIQQDKSTAHTTPVQATTQNQLGNPIRKITPTAQSVPPPPKVVAPKSSTSANLGPLDTPTTVSPPPKPSAPAKLGSTIASATPAATTRTTISPSKPSAPMKLGPRATSAIQRILHGPATPRKPVEDKLGGKLTGEEADQKQVPAQTEGLSWFDKLQASGRAMSIKPIKPQGMVDNSAGTIPQANPPNPPKKNEESAGGVKKPVQIRPVAKAKNSGNKVGGRGSVAAGSSTMQSKVVAPPGKSDARPTTSVLAKVQKHILKEKRVIKPNGLKPTITGSTATKTVSTAVPGSTATKIVSTALKTGSTFAARQANAIKSRYSSKAEANSEMHDVIDDYCWDFVNNGFCTRGNNCPFVHRKVSQAELAASMKRFTAQKAKLARERGGNSEATEKLEYLFREAGLSSNSAKVLPQEDSWRVKCKLTPVHGSDGAQIAVRVTMGSMKMGDQTMLLWCYWLNQKLLQMREALGEDAKQITVKAYEIDFSGNDLGVHGLRALCALLEKHYLRCTKLNLDDNKVDDDALKEITRHLTNFEIAPVEELLLHSNRLSPKGLCWLLTSVAMHPAYPIFDSSSTSGQFAKSGKFKPLLLHLDPTSFSDGVGDDMGIMLQDVSGACFVTVSTGTAETQLAGISSKHNLVVSLHCRGNWLSLPAVRPENHAKPIFAEPPVNSPLLANSVRTQPSVLYEYDEQAVVYKPAGWICDPKGAFPKAHTIPERTRILQIEALCRQDQHATIQQFSSLHFGGNEAARATRNARLGFGLCHRLDVGTSGPVLMGKTDKGYQYGCDQIYNRDCVKDYLALVHGDVREERGAVRAPIDKSTYQMERRVHCTEDGDPALTIWEVIAKYESPRNPNDKYTLLHFRIVTGRTHQIRVHCSHMGHPIVSDWTYAKEHQNQHWTLVQDDRMCKRIFLHKFRLAFVDMEGYVCSVPCPLQMAPELWNCLKQLRLVGGIALRDCGAPGLPKARQW